MAVGKPRPRRVERLPCTADWLGERAERVLHATKLAEGRCTVRSHYGATYDDIDPAVCHFTQQRLVGPAILRIDAPLDHRNPLPQGGTPVTPGREPTQDQVDARRFHPVTPIEGSGQGAERVAPHEHRQILERVAGVTAQDNVSRAYHPGGRGGLTARQVRLEHGISRAHGHVGHEPAHEGSGRLHARLCRRGCRRATEQEADAVIVRLVREGHDEGRLSAGQSASCTGVREERRDARKEIHAAAQGGRRVVRYIEDERGHRLAGAAGVLDQHEGQADEQVDEQEAEQQREGHLEQRVAPLDPPAEARRGAS